MLDAMADYIVAGCKMRNGEHPTEEKVASLFNRQELANIAWSCAVLEKYPPELMPILYTGLIGKDEDPEQMRQVMKDSGLQRQSIRTLYYVRAYDMICFLQLNCMLTFISLSQLFARFNFCLISRRPI